MKSARELKRERFNTTTNSISRTKKEIFRAHLCTFFNFLNVFLGALVLMTGQIKNLTFMFTIIANSVIGIIQELKVKSLVDKLVCDYSLEGDDYQGWNEEADTAG